MNIPIGWLAAVASVFAGYLLLGGSAAHLFVPQEFLVIFGSALGTLIAANRWRNLKNMFIALVANFGRPKVSKTANLALLCLMFELLQKMKRDGALAIDEDIRNPATSPLFQKYPLVRRRKRLVEFICDYVRMMTDGSLTLSQLENVMQQEIEVVNQEAMEPSASVMTVGDGMPAFGIVAALIGVIHTLTSIGDGKSPGEIGASIGSALVGTLLGVFSAYVFFMPVAKTLEQLADADVKAFEAVKEILIANYSNFSPMIAVEYGRKVMYADQRPSMVELETGIQRGSFEERRSGADRRQGGSQAG